MSELPKAPIFYWNPKSGYFDMEENPKTTSMANTLGLLGDGDANSIVYASDGVVWSFRFERPRKTQGIWTKLLAQVYNPLFEVGVTWTRERTYELDELLAAYLKGVEEDDDILTQFVDGDKISRRIKACKSFQDLVETWEWANADHFDEDEHEGDD